MAISELYKPVGWDSGTFRDDPAPDAIRSADRLLSRGSQRAPGLLAPNSVNLGLGYSQRAPGLDLE
jgi:hypothetical protein